MTTEPTTAYWDRAARIAAARKAEADRKAAKPTKEK